MSKVKMRPQSAAGLAFVLMAAWTLLVPGPVAANEYFQRRTQWRCPACHQLGRELDGREGLNPLGVVFMNNGYKIPSSLVSAKLSLQSVIQPGANGINRIPISRSGPAYTAEKLDIAPAIYLDVTFADGSKAGPRDYHQYSAENVIFDDTSGNPNGIIKVVYWNVDDNNPQLGKYAAQLTSTGKGVGTAYLKVSFRNALRVTASVPVEVVSGAQSQ